MFQYLINFLSSAYVEIAILVLMLVYFFKQSRAPRLMASGIRLVRAIIIVMVFAYFTFIWASTVEPSLRNLSVFGMFMINLMFFYRLILGRLERPYREALEAMGNDPEKPGVFRDIWTSGKRFYHYYYILKALVSGSNPFHFLRDMANDRVQGDIKDTLRRMGVEKKLISLKLMIGFMKSRLDSDATLPEDFKMMTEKTIGDLEKHPWLEEQINEFLRIATDSPEDLHFPEWMASFKKIVTEKK